MRTCAKLDCYASPRLGSSLCGKHDAIDHLIFFAFLTLVVLGSLGLIVAALS